MRNRILIPMSAMLLFVLAACDNAPVSPQTDTTQLWPAGKYIEEEDYILYGYINRNGKFVIEPQYDYASTFSCGYAIVYDENKKQYYYIDTKGNQQSYSSTYAPDLFYYGFAKVTFDGLDERQYGFINTKFEYVIDMARGLTNISDHMTKDGYIWSCNYKSSTNSYLYSYMHLEYADIISRPIDEDHTYLYAADFIDGYAVTATSEGFGIINTNYESTLKHAEKNGMLQNIGYGLFAYREAENLDAALRLARTAYKTPITKIIDANGNTVADNINYQYIQPFIEGEKLAVFCNSDRKCGYIDRNGREAIKAQYESADDFSEGYACVQKDDEPGCLIDQNGKVVLTLSGDEYEWFEIGMHNGLFLVMYENEEGEGMAYKDVKGKVIYSWRTPYPELPCAPRRFGNVNGSRPVKHYAIGGC